LKNLDTQLNLNSQLNWFLSNKSKCIDSIPFYEMDLFRLPLLDHVKLLRESHGTNKKTKINFLSTDLSEYDNDKYFDCITEIRRALSSNENIISDFIIHGSLADMNIVRGWSDFDSMCIINDDVLSNHAMFVSLIKLARNLTNISYQVDPYQHHGIHFIFESELGRYPEIYLPSNLFEDAKSLMGKSCIELHSDLALSSQIKRFKSINLLFESSLESGVMMHHAKDGAYLRNNFMDSQNAMYQFKYFGCLLMILPSYFINLQGIKCKKSESFIIAKEMISKENWKIIEDFSYLRSNWTKKYENDNRIHSEIMKLFDYNYFRAAKNLSNEMINHPWIKNIIL